MPKRIFALFTAVILVFVILFLYSSANNFSFDYFSSTLDLIEESQAEETSKKVDLEKFGDGSLALVDVKKQQQEKEKKFLEQLEEERRRKKIEEEEKARQAAIVARAVEKKTVPAKRKRPASISKYGIVFYPPVQYKKDSQERLVCIHKNDKPGISTQDKPVHIDMECCLDPDEIPNPFCHYSRSKYGKILDDFERKKEKMLRRFHQERGL